MDDIELTELKAKIAKEKAEHKRLEVLLEARNMGLIPHPNLVAYGFLNLSTKRICPKCNKELSNPVIRAGFEIFQHDCGYEYVIGRANWIYKYEGGS